MSEKLTGKIYRLCVAFEESEKAILTLDSIQLCGVGRYGSGITDVEEYLKTVER